MEIPVWERRPATVRGEAEGCASATAPQGGPSLTEIAAAASRCTACALHRTRNRVVFGTGAVRAACMLIGEAPGRDEDLQGEPFVGRAGRLLNSMLAAIGLRREDVYIANIIKCRPPKNRDPLPEEVAACARYLRQQIELVGPSVIVALGRVAAQNLLGSTQAIGRMRGQRYTYPDSDVPVVVTYHPAYLLRSPLEKSKVWDDLKLARRHLTA